MSAVRKERITTHVHSLGADVPQAPFCAASDDTQRATAKATDPVSFDGFGPPVEARGSIGST
jgi:hypothetical protein